MHKSFNIHLYYMFHTYDCIVDQDYSLFLSCLKHYREGPCQHVFVSSQGNRWITEWDKYPIQLQVLPPLLA